MADRGIQHIQPPGIFPSQQFGFTQVVTSPPGRLVFVSGQVAWDEKLQLVGGEDLAAQAEQALANLGAALRAAGATPADLVSLRVYVVDYEPRHAGILAPVLAKFLAGAPPPAQTLLGIGALAAPGLRIEIEAFAVVAD